MNWSDVANTVKDVAGDALPMLGQVLGGPMGKQAGSLVASALGVEDSPDKVAQALKSDPEAVRKLKEAEMEHKRELQKMHLEAATAQQKQINKTMRDELKAESLFKSGWRPWIGWMVGTGLGAILAVLVYSIFKDPASAPKVVESATTIITISLAVLGVNIKKRSDDKAVAAGQHPMQGALSKIVDRLGGGKGG